MSEVPDHLLERSRARRAALGLGGDDAGAAAAPAAAAADTGAAVEKAPTTAAAKAPAAGAIEAAPKPPAPVPHYVAASLRRKRVPVWAMPVLAFLPVWGVLYAQTLSPVPSTEPTQLELGKEVYTGKCAGCHGPAGGGGSGRAFAEGEILLTFPNTGDIADGITGQVEFVNIGTEGIGAGKPYGDPKREGGVRLGGSSGANMPPWHSGLEPLEIFSVVRYEREVLGGEEIDPARLGPEDELLWPNGSPMVDATGELIDDAGQPMLDADGKLLARPAYEAAG